MPLLRYFVFVGAALLALLLISDAHFPKEAVADGTVADAARSTLRIQSDQKWPEKIVIDTTLPTIAIPQTEMSAVSPAPKAVADIDTTTAPSEAFVQAQSTGPKRLEQPTKKKRVAKVQRYPTVASTQNPGLDFFAWR